MPWKPLLITATNAYADLYLVISSFCKVKLQQIQSDILTLDMRMYKVSNVLLKRRHFNETFRTKSVETGIILLTTPVHIMYWWV